MALMIFAKTRTLAATTTWLSILLLISACGTRQVLVQGQFPTPVMDRVPITLGVWYEDEFSNHVFFDETKSKSEADWIVETGPAQVAMWNTLLAGMFENLVHIQARPSADSQSPLVDAILIPHVEELQYTLPSQTNVNVYEIWLRYRFEVVSTRGEAIAELSMTAYGKTPTAFLKNSEKAINLAAIMALRDAGAHFALNFSHEPALQQWLHQFGTTELD